MKKKSGRRACFGPTRPTSDPTALGTALKNQGYMYQYCTVAAPVSHGCYSLFRTFTMEKRNLRKQFTCLFASRSYFHDDSFPLLAFSLTFESNNRWILSYHDAHIMAFCIHTICLLICLLVYATDRLRRDLL